MQEKAQAALQKRSQGKTSATRSSSAGKAGKAGGDMKFYSDDSTGLKVQPKSVLVISLVYLGVVVLLHIFGKIKGGSSSSTTV